MKHFSEKHSYENC